MRTTVKTAVTTSLGVFSYAAASGTLRMVLLAGMLRWLPAELCDGDAAAAAIDRALAIDGYT